MNVQRANRELAPIVLFVYNRPRHTEQTLQALAVNELADQSTLYIYSDGPKYGALAEDLVKIAKVREVIRRKPWCREVKIIESYHNKGLADSIVGGVTEVVNRHGRVAVLEDDILTRKGWLRFMNDALEVYADDSRVMHVSGMIFGTPRVSTSSTAFLRILSCNGWGTWKRAWDHYIHDADVLMERLKVHGISAQKFDIEGGAHFYRQLVKNHEGAIYTWAVRWYASWLTAGGYTLFPFRSLLTNIGHDGTGEHPPASFYEGETVEYLEVKKMPVEEDLRLRYEIDRIWREGRAPMQTKKRLSVKKYVRLAFRPLHSPFRVFSRRFLRYLYPELGQLDIEVAKRCGLFSSAYESTISPKATLVAPYHLNNATIGDYTYVMPHSWISMVAIGKFCSIGPSFRCGGGIHPTEWISTSPMFYSRSKVNGYSLSRTNKVQERKPITIGNDVFIGMNVTILDGVTVGDGAVIGAGSVVPKDVPPYAIVAGNPMKLLRYRFPEEAIENLRKIAWWDWADDKLPEVERYCNDIIGFISQYASTPSEYDLQKPEAGSTAQSDKGMSSVEQ